MNRLALFAIATLSLVGATPFWVMAQGGRVEVASLDSAPVAANVARALSADAEHLQSCVQARKGGRSAAHCVGTVAESCLASRPAEAACLRREAQGWTAIIDHYRGRLELRFGQGSPKAIRLHTDHVAWLADRERRCAGEGAETCAMKENGRRALFLRHLVQENGLI